MPWPRSSLRSTERVSLAPSRSPSRRSVSLASSRLLVRLIVRARAIPFGTSHLFRSSEERESRDWKACPTQKPSFLLRNSLSLFFAFFCTPQKLLPFFHSQVPYLQFWYSGQNKNDEKCTFWFGGQFFWLSSKYITIVFLVLFQKNGTWIFLINGQTGIEKAYIGYFQSIWKDNLILKSKMR